jgi:glycosyltransferase involved in cell wall biosynthesis
MSIDSAKPSHWIVHDYLQVNGGAERLVLTLAQGLPGWGVAVSGVYADFSGSASFQDVKVLGRCLPGLPRIVRALLTFVFPIDCLKEAKTVVYSGVYAPLAVWQQSNGLKVLYCHTPPGFAFNRQKQYERRCPLLLKPLLRLGIALYRMAYLKALKKMDLIITNSEHVRQRLKALTGFESSVVYPPISTSKFLWQGQGDYYLSLGRLEPRKRVDRIVRAFLTMPDKKLVIVSGGSMHKQLMALAKGAPNIAFTHWLDDQQLSKWLGNAIATLYIPEDEDFGMSAVESMSAGKPVISVIEGGLRESLVHEQTGLLLPPDPSPEAIAQAVRLLTAERAMSMRDACQQRAEAFSTERFLQAFTLALHSVSNSNSLKAKP